jgi:hypothetical protein
VGKYIYISLAVSNMLVKADVWELSFAFITMSDARCTEYILLSCLRSMAFF